MTAQVTLGPLAPDPADPAGVEAAIARRMPSVILGSVMILGIGWWMAAQPPQQPPPWDPSQQAPTHWAPGAPGYPPHADPNYQRPPQRSDNSGCADCSDCSVCVAMDCGECMADGCMSSIDCGDCVSCDCATAAATGGCAVPGASATSSATSGAKSCSTSKVRRLAESSGLLLPLLVLVGWRRRLRR